MRLWLQGLWMLACLAFGGQGARAAASYEPYAFTHLAGSLGGIGYSDGTGSAARFDGPSGVAVDSSGHVYVADLGNNTIRKITPGGVVSTLAGLEGVEGSDDGTGSAARFNSPADLAVDALGNVYVADTDNHTIRKITPGGVVTTLAGQVGFGGSDDGTGPDAQFDGPSGVAVDASGNVYVADKNNHTIRKITPGGVVTTLAGLPGSRGSANGTGDNARFFLPSGVAVDSSGNVYVADYINSTIRKITPGGVVSTLAGLALNYGSTNGTGSAARFNYPSGVAVDASGNVYVADEGNETIRRINPGGVVTTLAGLAETQGSDDGTGSAARFYSPRGVAVDASGRVYVADFDNQTIRKIGPGNVVTTLAGLAGSSGSADGTGSAARFAFPAGVAVDSSGHVYVADTGNHTIRKITPGGVVSTLAGLAQEQGGGFGSADGTGSAARFRNPAGVAVDSSGYVYVADSNNSTIRKITPGGVVTTLAGLAGTPGSTNGTGSAARFSGPYGVAVDAAGNVYVADTSNQTIRKITPGGVVTTLAGLAETQGSDDGTGSAARFKNPVGIAVDASGQVYVADIVNHTIRKITPGGVVTTLAGLAGSHGSDDGTGSAARFYDPGAVAVDASGNVYVADEINYSIRKITPGGVVTTLAGRAGSSGSDDGTGSAARFAGPYGVAVDSSGTVYVADKFIHAIRKGRVTPRLTIAPDGSAGFFIRFQGAANLSYQLHRAQALNGPWTTNAVQTALGSGLIEFHDLFPPPGRAFYRAFQE